MKPEAQEEQKSRWTRVESAARSPFNLLGLSICVAISAATLTPWPVLIGVVLEIVYLALAASKGSKTTEAKQVSEDRPHFVPPAVAPPAAAPPAAVVVTMPAPITRPTQVETPPPPSIFSTLEASLTASTSSKASASADSPSSDPLSGDLQSRYLRLEATFRLIQLQLDPQTPGHRELLEHLSFLMDRFVYFASKQDMLHERLQSIASDARTLRSPISPAAGVVDLQLVYAAGETGEYRTLDEWVHAKMKLAHDGYEQALRDVAWRRQERVGEAHDPALEVHARHLLRCNKNVDKIGKTLLNLHYELQLLDKRFSMTSEEISTRRFEQVLADVKALVLQTQSLTRTVDDIEPFESASEYAAA